MPDGSRVEQHIGTAERQLYIDQRIGGFCKPVLHCGLPFRLLVEEALTVGQYHQTVLRVKLYRQPFGHEVKAYQSVKSPADVVTKMPTHADGIVTEPQVAHPHLRNLKD